MNGPCLAARCLAARLRVAALGAAALVAGGWWTATAAAQGGPASVAVEQVEQRTIAAPETFIGTVLPVRRTVVGSAVDGRVEEFLVEEGDRVAKDETATAASADEVANEGATTGDALLGEAAPESSGPRGQRLVQLRIKTISISVAAAAAEFELRDQELAELEAGSRPEEKEQARAELARAKALHNYVQARYQRTLALFQRNGTATQEELDEALSTRLAAEQAQIAAQAKFDLVMKGPRVEQINQARARLLMAREEVNRLVDRKSKYTIRAPFDGYVVAKHTEVGAWISEGDPVVEVVQLDPVEIVVSVPEAHISNLRAGMTATIHIDSLKDEVITRPIFAIVPSADLRSRSFPVKIRLANPDTRYKAGMLAHVTLPVGKVQQQALLVPKDALVLDDSNPYPQVYVVRADAAKPQSLVAQPVPVRIGVADGSLIQIIPLNPQAIRAGEAVVVRGNERLRPNQPVRIVAGVARPDAAARSTQAK